MIEKRRELLSVKDAAETLKISEQRIKQLIYEGRLQAEKVGNQWIIFESALEFVAERPTGRPPKTENGTGGDSQNKQPLKTAFDIAPDLMRRLSGKHRSGIGDLSANKKHLEDLGKKSAEKEGL